MDLILNSATNESLTLNDIKEKLNILEERYLNSLNDNIDGDKNLLEEIKAYRKLKLKVINKSISTRKAMKEQSIVKNKKSSYNQKIIIDFARFDSKAGFWIVSYHENGKSFTEKFSYHQKNVDSKNRIFSSLKEKYGTKHLKKISIGLHSALNLFDEKHNTNEAIKYLKEKSNYIIGYDLKDIFKTNIYDLKEKFKLLIEAQRQKKYRKATVETPKFSYVTGTVILGGFLLAVTGAHSLLSKETKVVTKSNVSTEIMNDNDSEKNIKEDKQSKTETIYVEHNNYEKRKTEKLHSKEYFLHDKLNLKELKLTDRAVNEVSSTNVKSLACDYYKISLVSVVLNNEIKELEEADFLENKSISNVISDYKEKYGKDIDIYVNLDGYKDSDKKMYSTIGWTNIEQLKNKENLTAKGQIEQLKQVRSMFVDNNKNHEVKEKVLQKTL